MLKTCDILDEKDPKVRAKNIDMTFPLLKEEKKLIHDMLEHLYFSQIEEKAKKYNLRPGMGLAGPQVGLNKNFFVVCHEEEENVFKNYVLINPKLISHSEELIYSSGGEGCLSVNRDVEGIVPRYARVTFEGYDENGNKVKYRAREELSIAFQHEMDHLNGILFFDHIDPKNPYKNMEYMREI
ncbi:MAG: peptide deformylase [Erysipelotrichaceae bacterium]|nr:peptide deformylase [Erysipelotrichaceae bacterium]